jgi:4-hydroxythreonine-4-phosphate dehydrogenase
MAITMGDASGVGPEIVLRRHAAGELDRHAVVFGDAAILQRGAAILGLDVSLSVLSGDALASAVPGALNVVDLGLLAAEQLTPGELSGAAGAASHAYVVAATRAAIAGDVAGVVTLPMNKEATQASHEGFIGHTELIAGLCETDEFAMMLANPSVAVAHVSAHVSLRKAIDLVSAERVRKVIDLANAALSGYRARPRIAVCGLNPHAGEHRMFGDEDEDRIRPAIEGAVADGLDVTGPHPADTVFYQAIHNDQHDAIICMYHDQGHAPMKLYGFENSVNVTIGLPIIRTSVDHGTAFDIAWQGKAFTSSLGHALDYAERLAGWSG